MHHELNEVRTVLHKDTLSLPPSLSILARDPMASILIPSLYPDPILSVSDLILAVLIQTEKRGDEPEGGRQ